MVKSVYPFKTSLGKVRLLLSNKRAFPSLSNLLGVDEAPLLTPS